MLSKLCGLGSRDGDQFLPAARAEIMGKLSPDTKREPEDDIWTHCHKFITNALEKVASLYPKSKKMERQFLD